jgi:Rieske Fe-S protein
LENKKNINRRQYVLTHISFLITWLVAACKPEKIEKEPLVAVKESKLVLLNIFPEIAVSGSTLDINWYSENIDFLTFYIKTGTTNWQIAADGIDADNGLIHLTMPNRFEKDELLTIKLSGGGKEVIRENIKTENIILPKSVEIIKIEPEYAIAGEQLGVYFTSENIALLTIELRDKQQNLLLIRNVLPSAGKLFFTLPDYFVLGERLRLKVYGDGVYATLENITTKNVLIINTVDYFYLKHINGIEKVHPVFEDIWLKRIAEKEMIAMSGNCTHAGCRIELYFNGGHFYCPCHGSKFSTDGLVMNGPASEPLKTYACEWVADGTFKLIY